MFRNAGWVTVPAHDNDHDSGVSHRSRTAFNSAAQNGETCIKRQTLFAKSYVLAKDQGLQRKNNPAGYVEAVVIPEGARNIRVEEVAEASNYLAVKAQSGEYYLNGGWFIQWDGDYEAAGTTIHYTREGKRGGRDKFEAPGPLKEPLHIMVGLKLKVSEARQS